MLETLKKLLVSESHADSTDKNIKTNFLLKPDQKS